jgi:hypothetical protein
MSDKEMYVIKVQRFLASLENPQELDDFALMITGNLCWYERMIGKELQRGTCGDGCGIKPYEFLF